jgi:FkbM family methyltransferase
MPKLQNMIKDSLRALPGPVLTSLRSIRDQVAIRSFTPTIVDHLYCGVRLRVRIADKISAHWYDRDMPELPEITFLKRQKLKQGAVVFDIGAHQGVIALALAKTVGDTGRVVAIEASGYNIDIARENKKLNGSSNLSLVPAAIAQQGGAMTRFSGCINGSVSIAGKLVCTKSVDDLTGEFGTPDVVLLDVEGYELRALDGAEETLKADANWYVEVHAGCGLERFGGSAEAVVDKFRDRGYSLYCQTDEHYRDYFRPMVTTPSRRFFMIAIRERDVPCAL